MAKRSTLPRSFLAGLVVLGGVVGAACSSDPAVSHISAKGEACQPGANAQCLCRDGDRGGTRHCGTDQKLGACEYQGTDCGENESTPPVGGTEPPGNTTDPLTGGTCTPLGTNKCGVVPNCGCANADKADGQTCAIKNWSTGEAGCVDSGHGGVRASCTTTSECNKGLLCESGLCRTPCTNVGQLCAGSTDSYCAYVTEEFKTVGRCTVGCDPRNPSAVCGAANCLWIYQLKATDCYPSDNGALHSECEVDLQCGPGLGCLTSSYWGNDGDLGAGKTCEKWCRLGVAEDCPSDGQFNYTCWDQYQGLDAPTSGGARLGLCR